MVENKFKPGDRVRCIYNPATPQHKLDLTKIYTVTRSIMWNILYLDGDDLKGYYCDRFELSYIKEFSDKLNKLID